MARKNLYDDNGNLYRITRATAPGTYWYRVDGQWFVIEPVWRIDRRGNSVKVARDIYEWDHIDDHKEPRGYIGEIKFLYDAEEAIGVPPLERKPRRKDTQRGRVYHAEWDIRDDCSGRQFSDWDEVQSFVDEVTAADWWATTFPWARRIVVDQSYKGRTWSRGGRVINGTTRQIKIANIENKDGERWAMNELVVLHEIAHCIQTQLPWHCPEFATLFLMLVFEFHSDGKRAGRRLEFSYMRNRVKYDNIRKTVAEIREVASSHDTAQVAAARAR